MTTEPTCPTCSFEYPYENGGLYVCPECGHTWSLSASVETTTTEEQSLVVKDASGTILQDGDSVTIIKDLKVKGATSALKVGTKVKNIRLVDGDHNIDCKIDGFGAMKLKSEFVRKV